MRTRKKELIDCARAWAYAVHPLDGEESLSEVGVFYPMVCLEYGNWGGWSFYGFAYMGFRCVLKMNIGTSQRAHK